MASAKVAPNSLARIHHHGRQASKQAVILSFRLAIDWGPTTAGQKSTRINPARSLFLGSFFFSFSFFCLQKTEHLVWLIAAANRQRLDLSLSSFLLFASARQPRQALPFCHHQNHINQATSWRAQTQWARVTPLRGRRRKTLAKCRKISQLLNSPVYYLAASVMRCRERRRHEGGGGTKTTLNAPQRPTHRDQFARQHQRRKDKKKELRKRERERI